MCTLLTSMVRAPNASTILRCSSKAPCNAKMPMHGAAPPGVAAMDNAVGMNRVVAWVGWVGHACMLALELAKRRPIPGRRILEDMRRARPVRVHRLTNPTTNPTTTTRTDDWDKETVLAQAGVGVRARMESKAAAHPADSLPAVPPPLIPFPFPPFTRTTTGSPALGSTAPCLPRPPPGRPWVARAAWAPAAPMVSGSLRVPLGF